MIVSAAGVLRAAPKREGTSNKLNWLGKKIVVLSNSLEMPNHAFGTRGMRGCVSAGHFGSKHFTPPYLQHYQQYYTTLLTGRRVPQLSMLRLWLDFGTLMCPPHSATWKQLVLA